MNLSTSSQSAAYDGKRFGRYRPLAVLGRGGMANVYLALSSGPGNFNKLAVIKELKPELADDPDFVAMFVDEARLAARLQHPNVVHTYGVIESATERAFVMEYLDGQPMNRVRTRLLPMGEAVALGAQLRILAESLAGLHYAHELSDYDGTPLNIVHRDVSPHNIFVTYAGQVKVVDFGIAKASDSSAQTQVGVIKGKLSYMAPEQALALPVDRRADVFAVGIMLWEAATGQRIWKGMADGTILNLLSTGNLPGVKTFAPHVPDELARITARALATDLEARYATAAELLADLEAFMRTMPACPGTRELGELVAQAFEVERSDIKSVIEDQMRSLRPGMTGEFRPQQLAQLPQPPLSVSHEAASAQQTSLSSPRARSAQDAPPSSPSLATTPPATLASAEPQPRATLGRVPLMVGAALVAGLATAVVVVVAMRSGEASRARVGHDPPALSAPPAVAPQTASVTLTVNPKTAQATIDGRPLLTPGPTTLPRDGANHVISVEARGYATRTLEVVLDGDKSIDVALDREGPVAPSTPAPVRPTTSAGPRPSTTTAPTPHGGSSDTDLGY